MQSLAFMVLRLYLLLAVDDYSVQFYWVDSVVGNCLFVCLFRSLIDFRVLC